MRAKQEPLDMPGVSAITLDLPRLRVGLEAWCEWTGNNWDKVQGVVGTGFRMCAADENAYTLAAGAVLRLIDTEGLDPERIGYLALGTESSTDNAVGAVIVKGMVDEALRARGRAPISRACEVPEFKHACLGGVYALKGAARYVATDGRDRVAIVVASDVAEYARRSTGEQTQGAGAVAMLVERHARLLGVDVAASVGTSEYRGLDFRKPVARFRHPEYTPDVQRPHDFPVFNGTYSTVSYTEQVATALDLFLDREAPGQDPWQALAAYDALLFHRPYHHMPVQALAHALVWCGARRARPEWLNRVARAAEVDVDALVREARAGTWVWQVCRERGVDADPTPLASRVARALRRDPEFRAFVAARMSLGGSRVRELGNLYTASLPAWLAAAVEEAADRDTDLAGARLLCVGYGSGDAAEVFPVHVAPTWREAAGRVGLSALLGQARDLTREEYEALHDGRAGDWARRTRASFHVTRVGDVVDGPGQDVGLEYYGLPGAPAGGQG